MKKRMSLLIALAALLSVGLYAYAAPAPTAHAAPPTSHTVIRTSGSDAYAAFSFTQGDVTGSIEVVAAPQGFQDTDVGPISGPAALAIISECDSVTCYYGSGVVSASELRMDTKKLTSATLEAVVPVALTNESGETVTEDVAVDLTWTGVGDISSYSSTSHYRVGHTFSSTTHFKGAFRNATVSGVVSYSSPLLGTTVTVTGADVEFAQLMSSGSMEITIQR